MAVIAVVALMVMVPAASATVESGILKIVSEPSGANVLIYHSSDWGNTYKPYAEDTTPCTYRYLSCESYDKYKVVFSKPGYVGQTLYVDAMRELGGGETYLLTAYLSPTPIVTNGYIKVSSTPSNASIYIDGVRYGTTPDTISVEGDMTHVVKLVKADYASQSKSVYVPAGGTSTVSMTLNPTVSYGYLSVTSNPTGANIYVDGVYKGQAPMTITLPTGNHEVALSKAGYTGFQKTVTIYEGATSSVVGVLAENVTSAFVNITSTPNGASVYIDGEYIGLTPSTGALSKEVKANTVHSLQVKKDGYETYISSFSLSTGQIESFSPTLVASAPSKGTINVSSVPAGALVYIDNNYVGPSPVIEVVSAGTHTVKLASLGYNDSINTVTVSAGQVYPLQVTMTPSSTPSTKSPFPVLGLLIGLGAAAVFAGKKLRR